MKKLTAYAALSFTATTASMGVAHYVLHALGVQANWLGRWGNHGPPMALTTALALLGTVVAIWCWPRNGKHKTKVDV